VSKRPKKKCCSDKPRCARCPIAMLAAGTLPEGYTVKKRRLVKIDGTADGHRKNNRAKKAKKRKVGRLPEAA
jgi:hypothetical protein